MKILHAISGKGLGGTRTVFLSHQTLFSDIGFETTIVLRPNALIREYIKDANKIVEINYNRKIPIKWQKSSKLKMQSVAEGMDIIWLHKPVDAFIWRQICPKALIVLTVHGFQYKHLENADYLIAVSEVVLDHLRNNGFGKTFMINNFLNNEISTHDIFWNKKITISSFGFFRTKKGFQDLIKALYFLRKFKPKHDYEAHIYGKGKWWLILRAMKLFLGLGKLHIHPWTNSPISKMKESEITVIPSRSESFSMITIEAMSQGSLVVSTRCRGPEYIITNGINGILTKSRSPKDLALTIKEILDSPENFTNLRINGRNMVNLHYTKEASKAKMINFFQKLSISQE